MSPDLYFAITLVVKMLVSAGFVLAATVAAERAGPLVGGLIATLPIAAGPTYFFLALDHQPEFIANSALASLATNPVIAIFSVTYAALAQRRNLLQSFGPAIVLWLVLAYFMQSLPWTLPQAILLNIVVFSTCVWLARPMRAATIPRVAVRWYDVVGRAVAVAILVAVVVGLSFRIGTAGTGMLAVFPIVLSSIIVIMHPRVGGKATAAVIANTLIGLVGFGLALITLYLTAVPLGPAIGLTLALLVSLAWGPLVIAAKRRGIKI